MPDAARDLAPVLLARARIARYGLDGWLRLEAAERGAASVEPDPEGIFLVEALDAEIESLRSEARREAAARAPNVRKGGSHE